MEVNVFRFVTKNDQVQLAVLTASQQIFELPQADFQTLWYDAKQQKKTVEAWVQDWIRDAEPLQQKFEQLAITLPIVAPEVWAAGVTYERSRHARNYEATAGKMDVLTCYDKVYDAQRPEIFFKSTAARTVGPEQEMCLRSDSHWLIPEPELALVMMKDGSIAGYTIGNDLSCRDIEGENPLYLPQAKVWKKSCAFGPTIRLAETVDNPYQLDLICRIYRVGNLVFEGKANTSQLKRKLDELVEYFIRDNEVYDGHVLFTGTCIVPPDEFSLADRDVVEIEIPGIGILRNVMTQLSKQ
jgi:2-dehydro-3-deoxy-D-arabinonate dehydratase